MRIELITGHPSRMRPSWALLLSILVLPACMPRNGTKPYYPFFRMARFVPAEATCHPGDQISFSLRFQNTGSKALWILKRDIACWYWVGDKNSGPAHWAAIGCGANPTLSAHAFFHIKPGQECNVGNVKIKVRPDVTPGKHPVTLVCELPRYSLGSRNHTGYRYKGPLYMIVHAQVLVRAENAN